MMFPLHPRPRRYVTATGQGVDGHRLARSAAAGARWLPGGAGGVVVAMLGNRIHKCTLIVKPEDQVYFCGRDEKAALNGSGFRYG